MYRLAIVEQGYLGMFMRPRCTVNLKFPANKHLFRGTNAHEEKGYITLRRRLGLMLWKCPLALSSKERCRTAAVSEYLVAIVPIYFALQ